MGCHFLLQGTLPKQGSNLGLCIASGFLTIGATREASNPAERSNKEVKKNAKWIWGYRSHLIILNKAI